MKITKENKGNNKEIQRSLEKIILNFTHLSILIFKLLVRNETQTNMSINPSQIKAKKMAFPISPSPRFVLLISEILTSLLLVISVTAGQQPCRTSCGNIPINYPFGIDDGCGSLYYRNLLYCSINSDKLELRTPTGTYPVSAISYSDPYILISDPDMWTCQDGPNFRPTRPFSLDPETHLAVSPLNDYLFFNCSEDSVLISPRPVFCGRFPDRCDESCDSASYLCTHVPGCGGSASSSCCSYQPKATDSLKMMLKHCASYTSVYWKSVGEVANYDQVPEYGIRIDFDIVITSTCLRCQDVSKGGGSCGFDVHTLQFLCICTHDNNLTTFCADGSISDDVSNKRRIIAGTVSAVSAAGALGIAACILFIKKLKAKAAPVTCGVQTNENRLF